MRNITALLKAAGADFNNVVRTTVYLRRHERLRGMNDGLLEAHRRSAARARHRAGGAPAARRQDRNRRHRGALVGRLRVAAGLRNPPPGRAQPSSTRVPRATRVCGAGRRCDGSQEAAFESRVFDARGTKRKHIERRPDGNSGRSSAMPVHAAQKENRCALERISSRCSESIAAVTDEVAALVGGEARDRRAHQRADLIEGAWARRRSRAFSFAKACRSDSGRGCRAAGSAAAHRPLRSPRAPLVVYGSRDCRARRPRRGATTGTSTCST